MMSVERVKDCVSKLTNIEKGVLDVSVNLNVYGLDSLARVELVILLEEEFAINFRDTDLIQKNFETINNIVVLLNEYGVEECKKYGDL